MADADAALTYADCQARHAAVVRAYEAVWGILSQEAR